MFSVETWFRTTTTSGGKIVGFGNANTGTSTNYDRHIYMEPNGRITFGVYNNGTYTVTTAEPAQRRPVAPRRRHDGPDRASRLYVDGKKVGTNGGTTVAQPYSGYWRIGGDSSWSGNRVLRRRHRRRRDLPDRARPRRRSRTHYRASGRTLDVPTRPTDAYGQAVWDANPTCTGASATVDGTAKDSGPNESNGIYQGGYVQGQAGAFDGADQQGGHLRRQQRLRGSSSTQYSNPRTYSLEAWFKTTSTNGGKIIGFGSSQTGTSGSYDRHVYMQQRRQADLRCLDRLHQHDHDADDAVQRRSVAPRRRHPEHHRRA